jgi:hypothetical protein
MKYVLSRTVAFAFHHSTSIHLCNPHFLTRILPHFTSLHFTSLHFTSLHCMLVIPSTNSLCIIYHFLTLFLKLLDLQERVPEACEGRWFQNCMVLLTNALKMALAAETWRKLSCNFDQELWSCTKAASYVCVCVCMCVFLYTHTHTHTHVRRSNCWIKILRRSQCPNGLRQELSSPVQTLGSHVRIPLEA